MIRLCWEFTVATRVFHVRFFLFSCLYKICRKAESFEVFEHTEKSFRIAFFSATPTEIAAFEKGNQDIVPLEGVKQLKYHSLMSFHFDFERSSRYYQTKQQVVQQ